MEVRIAAPTVEDALDDVSMRFIVNLPAEELSSVDRLFFQLQQGHWYYLDFYQSVDETLPYLSFRDFTRLMFERCPLLAAHKDQYEELRQEFKDYMGSIPVYGVILLNSSMTSVLLIRPWKKRHWVFPKGKINEGETELQCAAREALEEIGYDCAHLLRADDSLAVPSGTGDKPMRFFIGVGAPEDGSVEYAPQMRMEVSEIGWFDIDRLLDGGASGRFYCVIPLIRRLKTWILARRKSGGGGGGAAAAAAGGGSVGGAAAVPKRKKKATGAAAAASSGGAGSGGAPKPGSAAALAATYGGLEDGLDGDGVFDSLEGGAGGAGGGGAGGRGGGSGGGSGGAAGPGAKGWSVSDMFAANERLLGRRFVYDGNPHTFGDERQAAVPVGPAMQRTGLLPASMIAGGLMPGGKSTTAGAGKAKAAAPAPAKADVAGAGAGGADRRTKKAAAGTPLVPSKVAAKPAKTAAPVAAVAAGKGVVPVGPGVGPGKQKQTAQKQAIAGAKAAPAGGRRDSGSGSASDTAALPPVDLSDVDELGLRLPVVPPFAFDMPSIMAAMAAATAMPTVTTTVSRAGSGSAAVASFGSSGAGAGRPP